MLTSALFRLSRPISDRGEFNSCLLIAKDGQYLLLKGFSIDCFDQRSPDDGYYWVAGRNGLDFRNSFLGIDFREFNLWPSGPV